MAKSHVGRPTKKEMMDKKIKKIIKVVLPISLITLAFIMIIANHGLRRLMGNSID